MQDLKDLIRVVSKHKIKQIEIIGNNSTEVDSKFQQLYDLVESGSISSDNDAMNILYPDHTNGSASYSKLKNRLKNRLINTLFFIDINQPQFTDIQQAFFTCNKNWLAIRVLLSRGARAPGIRLAENTIRVALKFEFTELIIYIAKQLRLQYSIVSANDKKYRHYSSVLDSALVDLDAESTAEKYYSEIMKEFSESQASINEEKLKKVAEYSNKLKKDYADIDSFSFIRTSYLLHIIRYQTSSEFEKAIDACMEAISIIENKPYQSNAAVFSFNLRLLSCYIQIRKYKEADTLAEHYSNSLTSGSYDWYIIQLYQFLSNSHSKNYNKCFTILQKAISHPKFKTFYANHKQIWYINQAFTHFLYQVGEIDRNSVGPNSQFRLYKFLNNIPIYSKDKRGINISILIVHVLLLLQQRKYSKIIDRVDALNQYCHRYLRRDDTFRANCFIKSLLQMPKSDFNRIRTERYAAKYISKLNTMPLNIADQGIEVEIVPYEDLWEMVLNLLN